MKACPGCGMHTVPVVEVQPRPVPTEGRVLFVATVPEDYLDAVNDPTELVEAVHAIAADAAPGRNNVVLLAPGLTLDMVTDDQLAALGLQRREQP